jgi:hypothetical protein
MQSDRGTPEEFEMCVDRLVSQKGSSDRGDCMMKAGTAAATKLLGKLHMLLRFCSLFVVERQHVFVVRW